MAWAEQTSPGRWRGRYTVTRGGQRVRLVVEHAGQTLIFSSKAEAVREAASAERDARRPGAHNPRAGRITWGQWQREWWPKRRVEDGTAKRDDSRRSKHLEPRWASVPLDEIDRGSVQDWVTELEGSGLAAATVHHIYHLMSASLKAAVLAGKIPANPCVSIDLPKLPPADDRFLTEEEIDRVCFFLDPPWSTLVLLLTGTGMRWGEMVALHDQRVHLDEQRIDITMAWDSKLRRYKTPKDHERRSVPILEWVENVLVSHRRSYPVGTVCGVAHPRGLGQRCTSSLVLPGRGGVPVDYDSFRRNHWEPAVGRWTWRAGDRTYRFETEARKALGPDAVLDRVWQPGLAGISPATIHDLRHTFASWFLQAGGTIEELSDLLGHADIKTTQRYAHLSPHRWGSIRERMAARGRQPQFAPDMPQTDLDGRKKIIPLERSRRSTGT